MKHIEFAKLIEKYERSLTPHEAGEIAEHLSGCAECSLMSKKIASFFYYAQTDKSAEVPQSVTANLLNIWQPKKNAAKKESLVNRIFGKLVFDDWQFALNERLAFSDTRQLLYKTKDFEIDLRLQFINGKCIVSGQVFPDLKENGKVKIVSDNAEIETKLNENCEFVFSPVAEGTYNLQLDIENTHIEISKLSLHS
jgi:hypothetical protein